MNESKYVFCPKCGGITVPGICVNCGYNMEAPEPNGADASANEASSFYDAFINGGSAGNSDAASDVNNTAASMSAFGTGDVNPTPTFDTNPAPTFDSNPMPNYEMNNANPAPTFDSNPMPNYEMNNANPAPTFDSNPMPNYGMNNANPAPAFDSNPMPNYGMNNANPAPSFDSNPMSNYGMNNANPAPAFDSNSMPNYGMNNTNQASTFDNNTFPGYGTNPAPQYNANPAQGYMQNPEFDTAAPKKKGVRWGLILGIGIPALVVLGSIVCCIGFVIITALGVAGTSTPGTTNPISTPSTSTTTYTYERQDHARASVDDFDNQTSNASKNNDSTNGKNDVYLKSDYESTFGSNHTNHARDTFSGPYYEQFMDSFDTSYGYSVRRHFIDYEDQTSAGIDINGKMAYVEIKDNGKNIPNLDKLNKEIKNITLYDLTEYLKGNTSYGEISSIAFAVDSFCIYNDDVKMSILFESNIYPDQSQYYNYTHYVYTINIDLEKGEIIENDSIFKADDAMGQLFKDTNDAQNGYVEAVAELSVSEIADMLNDSSCNIVFFTPVGLEIGFNYYMVSGTDKSWGWVTISIEDYDQYLLDQKYKKNETACSSNGTPLTQADTENGVGVEDDGTQSGEDASEQSTEDGTGENGTDTEIPSVEVPSIEIPDFSDLIGEPETM